MVRGARLGVCGTSEREELGPEGGVDGFERELLKFEAVDEAFAVEEGLALFDITGR